MVFYELWSELKLANILRCETIFISRFT